MTLRVQRGGVLWLAVVALASYLAAAPSATAQDGASARPTRLLFLDLGDPDGAPTRPSAQADMRGFADSLRRHTGAQLSSVTVVAGARMSRASIRDSVVSATASMQPGETLILHIRGYVTKPASERAIYFYPGDSDVASHPPGDPRPIRDRELIDWLDNAPQDTQALLFLDLWTTDDSLLVYFASRPSIGDASVTTVSSVDAHESMAAGMSRLLGDSADTDANGVVDIHELGRLYRDELYDRGATTAEVIAGLTGDALPLFNLPSAIMIGGPIGARAFVDGTYVGDTPLRYKPAATGVYDVTVEAAGYRRPDPRLVEITEPMGEALRAGFLLDPVRVRGVISAAVGASVGSLLVGVMPGGGVAVRLDAPGAYEIPADFPWVVGSAYRVLVGSPDERHFGAASFTYGGYDDIAVDISLAERTLWEVAGIYHSKGLAVEAVQAAAAAADGLRPVPDALGTALGLALLDAWSAEAGSARVMIACARITDLTHGGKTSRRYWKLAKQASERGSEERRLAAAGLRASGGSAMLYALIGLVALAASGGIAALRYRRARSAVM